MCRERLILYGPSAVPELDMRYSIVARFRSLVSNFTPIGEELKKSLALARLFGSALSRYRCCR
jgi:hypothetical protein